MKIAVNTRFLLADRLTGTGKFTHEILQRLSRWYPEHEFYFFFDRAYDQRFVYSTNVKPVVIYPSARHPVLNHWWYQVSVSRALKKLQPDVFLSTDSMTTLNTTVPRVTVMQDIAFEHYPREMNLISRKYFKFYSPRFAQVSGKIIAGSEFARREISRQYNINPEKIAVIYQAAGEEFSKINFEKQVALRTKFTGGEAFFLFGGTLQPRHNLVSLFRAFDIFKQKTGSEVKLVVVGRRASLTGNILKSFRQMHFKTEVVFTGRLDDAELVSLYGAAIALVYIPSQEGVGLPVLEAQKCSCPVIMANTGALPEIAGDGAIQVNLSAEEEIADALIKVYHELDVRAHLVQEGLRNAALYTWDRSSEEVMRLLEEVVKAKAGSGARI